MLNNIEYNTELIKHYEALVCLSWGVWNSEQKEKYNKIVQEIKSINYIKTKEYKDSAYSYEVYTRESSGHEIEIKILNKCYRNI